MTGGGAAPSRRSGRPGWFLRISLRARLTIIGVAGVAVALTIGSIALYTTLSLAVNRTLDNEARASASDAAALIDKGTPPDPLPISGAQVIQVVDAAHRVVDGSINADRLTPLLHADELQSALGGGSVTVAGSRAGLAGPLRVVAQRAGPADAHLAVVVAVPVSDVLNSVQVLRTALFISDPVLLLLLALIAWYVIGRALRPVEELRRGADRISGTGQSERLPVPQSTDEIAALALTLNQMLDRLAAARDRQRNFVADAAHELRSPLASILVQLEVAQRLSPAADESTLAEDVLTDVRRLSGLVEDLLLLAKADADVRTAGQRSSFDVQDLLAETVRGRSDAGITVGVVPGESAMVTADRSEIRRAIGNLLDNAMRSARTQVQLAAQRTGDDVTIAVTDDGPGIPPADRERVFQRFTRLDDARDRDAGGSGLGLAIVQELVRRAGGTVTLDAASDDPAWPGLRATVTLPAGAPPAEGG